ncbi:uncharacterized protein LOC144630121 [Oculina patagonica]
MAENLPFSIANILRSDFPHPSRISKVPSIVHATPLRESRRPLFFAMRCLPVQRLHPFSTETITRASLHRPRAVGKDFFQEPGDVQEQKHKRLTGEKKEEDNINRRTVEEPQGSKTTGEKVAKKKRNRSHFSQFQLKYLEDIFSRQQYLTRDERALVASALEMKELQIRNWFQNRRYLLRHRRVNRTRQVPIEVLVSSSAHASEVRWQ